MVLIGGLVLITIWLLPRLWWDYIMATTEKGAPFQGMDPDAVKALIEVADIKQGDVLYDLGSGDGRVIIGAGLKGARAIGVEIDLLRVIYSRFWVFLFRLHPHVRVLWKDIFNVDLSDADIVCTYLLEQTNEKLQKKLATELKEGTRVISVGFKFPGWHPIKTDPRGTVYGPIYVYQK